MISDEAPRQTALRRWVCYSAFFLLPFLLAAPLWPSSPATEKVFEDKTGTQWYPFLEWSIENPTYDGNPFDVEAEAVFVHAETGQFITTPLFYDGDDTWNFRFTGTRTSEWTVQTHSQDDDLAGWSGQVSITENSDPDAHGFMTAFDSKWGWQGTEEAFVPQYVMGKNPSAYLDEDGAVETAEIEADIQEFVDKHGFTGFHIPVGGRWFDGKNPDPRVYRVVEQLIQETHERGGASHIWLWGSRRGQDGSGPDAFAEGPMSEIDRRNLRYLAARLGPLPGWSMGYGYDTENGWALPEELDAWKDFLEDHLGWDHFLGARVGYDEKGLWAVSPQPPRPPRDAAYRAPIADKYTTWLGGDYIGYTSYRPLYPRYREVLQHHPEKPSFEEDRFRLRNAEEWGYKDYWPELTRRGLWHSAMAGGVANIWGNLLPHSENELGSHPYDNEAKGVIGDGTVAVDIKHQIKTYARFFEDRFFREMESYYDGPELRLMVPEGGHAIIYREDSDVIRLNLRDLEDRQPAVAVDTKNPYEEIEVGLFSAGQHTWEAPYRSDWAIAVGEF